MNINFVSLIFVVTVMCFVTGGETLRHRCIHDQIANKYPKTFIPHLGKESADGVPDKRQADEYLPFRIAVHYLTDNITNSSVIPVLNDPSGGFQLAINYFQSVLSVIRASHNLSLPSNCTAMNNEGQCTNIEPYLCGDYIKLPIEHSNTTLVCDPTCREVGGGVDADFILYVIADFDECQLGGFEDALAYAFACVFDENNNRPLVGVTNICPAGFAFNTIGFFQLMLHEILHALGFSSNLFEYFAHENGVPVTTLRINGADVYAINSTKVLNYGREYYNCPDLEGVLLENEGGPGSANSHWETRTTNFEVMTASADDSAANSTSISNFTLLLLEDSGWYQVDYAMAESLYYYEYLWGKGLGCNFLTNIDCDNWQYSCPQLFDYGCSYDYQARSVCVNSTFSDGCYFFYPIDLYACNSPGGSCLPVMNETTTFPFCFNRTCYRYTETGRLFYTFASNDTDILCPYGATIPLSDEFMINCPPAESVCSRSTLTVPIAPSNIPQNFCHDSCATCSRPASSAHCSTCGASLTLRGTAPSVCTTDNCGGGEFQDLLGNCVACAAGCRACTGPNIVDCLACEDETLYRLTTNQASSSSCVTAAECDDTAISAFGDRTCSFIKRGGGASSTHYHQALLLFLMVVYLL